MALLTAGEVAERLRVALPTVYGLAQRGVLPVVHVGRALRFEDAAVQAFVARGGTRQGEGAADGAVATRPD